MLRALTASEFDALRVTARECDAWLRHPVTERIFNRVLVMAPPAVVSDTLESAAAFKNGYLQCRDEFREMLLNVVHNETMPAPPPEGLLATYDSGTKPEPRR